MKDLLRLSRFDAVSSFLSAVMIFLGTTVSMLFLLWLLASGPAPQPGMQIERTLTSTSPIGFAQDFEPPGAEEVADLREPSLAETVDAVSTTLRQMSPAVTTIANPSHASSNGFTDGKFDARSTGPGDIDAVGRWERWEIVFHARGIKDYASQLDFFGIELAAFGGGDNAIESASLLATHPVRHVNRQPSTEQRLYFSWKRTNPFVQFDRQLLAAANIPTDGRNVVRFIPRDLEDTLASMEKAFCENNGRSFPGDIAKTTFQSSVAEKEFVFQVVNQRYRSGPDG
ncbi:hypothetical protein NZK35_17525 [Stieleria sp. ICT_E10.1]|uniref:hypothetical protein n=1 Tax=Stieleria sedimenti TaxID=2976331 RepID=UPI0021800A5B|nr:hypothetical protein [Stieleria sedimenti]MCS7468456.1 hypothetical protein [Stieleria sedimenti]